MNSDLLKIGFALIMIVLLFPVYIALIPEKTIGGETDEHDCLISAGYQWCPSTQKCQRMWEEYCPEYKDQFKIESFEDCVAAGNPVMESYPRKCMANGETFTEVITHRCTEEDKKAEMCTMEYNPVCGDNNKTYSNSCVACSSGEIDSWNLGECK